MSHWDIITLDDRAQWDAVVGSFAHDIYHEWGYHRLAFECGEGDPVLITWSMGSSRAAMPLLIRPIPAEPGCVDATSVYGFPGPLSNATADPGGAELLAEALEELGLVSAFSRLNPFLDTAHALDGIGTTTTLGPTVSIDLSIDAEVRVAGYSRSARRRIRKLEQAGAEAFIDDEFAYLDTFMEMYEAAMLRLGAEACHRFQSDYHGRLADLLGDSVALVVCRLDDDILSAGLYLTEGDIVHAHLAADRPCSRHLAPQRFELHSAAQLFASRGHRWLHLGGGVGSTEDGLLAFKRGFGGTETRFSIWSHVVDTDAYARFCASTAAEDDGYFPAYRQIGPRRGRVADRDDDD